LQAEVTEDPEFRPQPRQSSIPISACSAAAAKRAERVPKTPPGASVEILQKRMKVTRQATTFLVESRSVPNPPQKAATIANAIADA